MEGLELVLPTMDYKEDMLDFLKEVSIADKGKPWQYAGIFRTEEVIPFEEWIQEKKDEEKGINLPENYVPASTYFCVRRSDNKVVGVCNIRHTLSDTLFKYGGHIGQTIRPSERGKGYGTKQLLMALDKCFELGIKNVLITCDEENKASARTIEKCMGKYENTVKYNGELLRRYWINVNKIKSLQR